MTVQWLLSPRQSRQSWCASTAGASCTEKSRIANRKCYIRDTRYVLRYLLLLIYILFVTFISPIYVLSPFYPRVNKSNSFVIWTLTFFNGTNEEQTFIQNTFFVHNFWEKLKLIADVAPFFLTFRTDRHIFCKTRSFLVLFFIVF